MGYRKIIVCEDLDSANAFLESHGDGHGNATVLRISDYPGMVTKIYISITIRERVIQ